MTLRPALSALIVLCLALLACKKDKRPPPAPAPGPDPQAELAQRRLQLGPSDFKALCSGSAKSVPDAEPREAGKLRLITFYKDGSKQGAEFEHQKYEAGRQISVASNWTSEATVVACVELVQHEERASCQMKTTGDMPGISTLKLFDADYRIRLIEARTGKLLGEAKKSLKAPYGGKCPELTVVEKGGEDAYPNWEASVHVLATEST